MFERTLTTTHVALAYATARWRTFASRAELERWQDRRVRLHLQRIVQKSEYYRDLYRGFDISDWRSLPITNKQAMMTNFQRYNTLGIGREEALEVAKKAERTRDFTPNIRGATVGLSSGTSGSYSLFLSSPRENATFIGTALARLLRGSILSPHRIAFFHRAHSNLYKGLDSGRLQHRFFDLSFDLESQFEELEKLSPTQIIGPPFVLRRLGEAVRRGDLNIRPRAILSVAEVLDNVDRESIESDFQLRIDQAYIATEGFIAATCPEGTLHINEDCLVIQQEWVDGDSGRYVPIITDFRRRIQPIIRYRLDDVLVDGSANCRCGSPFATIERIEGRLDDVLVAKDKNTLAIRRVFPDFVRRSISACSDRIREYRICQNSLDDLIVSLDVDEKVRVEAQRLVLTALTEMFDRLKCYSPTISFTDKYTIDAGKKIRRVVRNFPTDVT